MSDEGETMAMLEQSTTEPDSIKVQTVTDLDDDTPVYNPTTAPLSATDDVEKGVPVKNGSADSAPTTPSTDRPVKPPRNRSMRAKESPMITPRDQDPELDTKTETNPDTTLLTSSQNMNSFKEEAVKPRQKFGLDYIMGHKAILLGIISVLLLVLILIVVGVSVTRRRPNEIKSLMGRPAPIAQALLCGQAVGAWELDDTVAVFKGIKYASAPVGSKRWTYDLQIENVTDCDNTPATEFKGPCIQPTFNKSQPYLGSEDCLYLNIWTPQMPAYNDSKERLPVLVYIHGGFLHFGSGHEELFSPSAQLAQELNAVIVSFNYRLNVFGWLAIDDLNADEDSDHLYGNYGLQDQITALKWVHKYIHSFGGDNKKVTVVGTSSGGTSVFALMAAEGAEPSKYFQRAWISGASTKFDSNLTKTSMDNKAVFLRNYGCSDQGSVRDCLRGKNATELIDGIPWIQYPSWGAHDLINIPSKDSFIGAVLVTDGKILAESPTARFQSQPPKIPIVIGTTEYESDRYQVTDVAQWIWPQYADFVRSKLDTFNQSLSDKVLDSFAPELKSDPRLHFAKLVSDLRENCPNTFISNEILGASANQTRLYRYVMTAATPQSISDKYLGGSSAATHATDMVMLFHYSDSDEPQFGDTKRRFRKNFREFMEEGSITDWEIYPKVMDLKSDSDMVTHRWTLGDCEIWKSFYPNYSWMN